MRAAPDQLTVVFHPATVGWVSFDLRWPENVFPVRATHFQDPYGRMMPWLENVTAGAAASRWSIGEEGCVAQLIYVAPVDMVTDWTTGQLVCHRSNEDGELLQLVSCPVTQAGLVSALYGAFRAYVAGPDYVPEEWEAPGGDPEEGPWSGDALRELRSDKLDAILMYDTRS